MSVTAIIVTRGDVELDAIHDSIPMGWETIVWNNGLELAFRYSAPWQVQEVIPGKDVSVYGRYAAIEYASNDLIYVQDDDCVVSNPQALVDVWVEVSGATVGLPPTWNQVVCNMPQEFRHSFYEDHALVGFGAAFHRDAPTRAFDRFRSDPDGDWVEGWFFRRTCDIVFTALTPRVLVDVPRQDLPWFDDDNRMWKQSEHQAERARMLALMKGMRDA